MGRPTRKSGQRLITGVPSLPARRPRVRPWGRPGLVPFAFVRDDGRLWGVKFEWNPTKAAQNLE